MGESAELCCPQMFDTKKQVFTGTGQGRQEEGQHLLAVLERKCQNLDVQTNLPHLKSKGCEGIPGLPRLPPD